LTYIIGVDIGGTFTDAFASDRDGSVWSAKAPSTPPTYSEGFLAALTELAAQIGVSRPQMLSDATYICHGTTTTLNALVTGRTADVGFLTTKGHRDSISIMNLEGRYAGRSSSYIQNIARTNKPAPVISKSRTREITERVDVNGEVVVPLDEDRARSAIAELLADGVEAIAVSLLWSFLNPTHERRLRELIHEQAPEMYVGLSSDLSPRMREYSRNVTTIMGTQVAPILRNYLDPLTATLTQEGLDGPFLIMQGVGGSVTAEEAPRQAIQTVGSVLCGGVIGSVNLAHMLGHRNVICTDAGGTTFLVGLIVDSEPVAETTTIINQHMLNVPMVKVESIGSGGGAIAWVDDGGNLRVGPDSAGARPGPACYGQGGTEPTVTDANLLLGIMNDSYFLGGRMRLSCELAERALLERVGRPLGMDAHEAAAAVFAVQNAQTADLVRKVVVESGYDPRDFALYAFGGSGPIHCHAYSADLGIRDVVVPLGSTAAAFSAFGLACADVVVSAELSDPAAYPVAGARVTQNLERLEASARASLRAQGLKFREIAIRREVEIRYTMQTSEVATPVPPGALTDDDVAGVVDRFEEKYRRLFGEGTGFREAGFQFITYRVFAAGVLPFTPQLPHIAQANGDGSRVAVKMRRPVLIDPAAGLVETTVYDYLLLRAGHSIEGPAVIEAPTTTVVIPADAQGMVDQLGNVLITAKGDGEHAD
jgi:N-methylhydantoinase A